LVGVFETTTISSRDPVALQAWLKANGFATPTNRDQAIASYVKDGWVFVTAKIRRDDPALQTASAHPLSFVFKTEEAVYPMRLTGIDNGPVQVDLYVFGPDRAKAPHFKVERCGNPVYPTLPLHHGLDSMLNGGFSPKPEILQIAHPLLRKWVDGTPVATKLTATLSPDDMRDDVWISWASFSEMGTSVFSHHGAVIYALNWGMGVIAAIILTAFVVGSRREDRTKRLARLVGLAAGFGIILTIAVYILLPKTEVRIVRGYRPPIIDALENFELIKIISTQETNLADFRVRMEWTKDRMNYFSGGYFREEDSPGNYQLRQGSNEVECVIYDASGAPSSE
jgi:hypothetical protein